MLCILHVYRWVLQADHLAEAASSNRSLGLIASYFVDSAQQLGGYPVLGSSSERIIIGQSA